MNGIFLVDKPEGMTSFDVIRHLKKKFNTIKIGHAGTLDPFATGLMIILVGHATKLSNHFLLNDKTYETTICFGQHTSTYDFTGEIIKEHSQMITKEMITKALPLFDDYLQEPPMVSAIKVKGQKLYELARKGKEVEREKRHVQMYQQKIIDFDYPHLKISLHVSKGTYIRSYAVDLAKQLETYAHITQLRRVQSGQFHIESAKSIENIKKEDLITIEKLLEKYPKIVVTPYIESLIKNGLILDHRQFDQPQSFRVFNENQQLIAFYEPINTEQYKIVFYNEAI
jgi:tRNA pseudouridine55 synthase